MKWCDIKKAIENHPKYPVTDDTDVRAIRLDDTDKEIPEGIVRIIKLRSRAVLIGVRK